VSLARLQEEKFTEANLTTFALPPNTQTTNSYSLKPKSNPNPLVINRFSLAELQSRRENNLCYYLMSGINQVTM